MPRFIAKPFVVEAFQFAGTLTDFPEHFVTVCAQSTSGGPIMVTTNFGQVECPTGDWVVRGMDGYTVLRNGEFGHMFDRYVDEIDETEAGAGEWAVMFRGDLRDGVENPGHLDWLGKRFPLRKFVRIVDRVIVDRVRDNAHFVVREPSMESETDEVDGFEVEIVGNGDVPDASADFSAIGLSGSGAPKAPDNRPAGKSAGGKRGGHA